MASRDEELWVPRTVTLQPPREERTVILREKGVTMAFGYGAFLGMARCGRSETTVDFLASRPEMERLVVISAAEDKRAHWVAAALLDQGRARVRDERTKRDATSIVRQRWISQGCRGGCRQFGREYRLQVPGEVFLQITDTFVDGPPVKRQPSDPPSL